MVVPNAKGSISTGRDESFSLICFMIAVMKLIWLFNSAAKLRSHRA